MIVRIKLGKGRRLVQSHGKNRPVARAVAGLLIPAALMAYVLGVWRLASDLGMAGAFTVPGLFSHWQVWIAIAVVLHAAAVTLNRYGNGGALRLPMVRALHFGPAKPRAASATLSGPQAPYDKPRPRAR